MKPLPNTLDFSDFARVRLSSHHVIPGLGAIYATVPTSNGVHLYRFDSLHTARLVKRDASWGELPTLIFGSPAELAQHPILAPFASILESQGFELSNHGEWTKRINDHEHIVVTCAYYPYHLTNDPPTWTVIRRDDQRKTSVVVEHLALEEALKIAALIQHPSHYSISSFLPITHFLRNQFWLHHYDEFRDDIQNWRSRHPHQTASIDEQATFSFNEPSSRPRDDEISLDVLRRANGRLALNPDGSLFGILRENPAKYVVYSFDLQERGRAVATTRSDLEAFDFLYRHANDTVAQYISPDILDQLEMEGFRFDRSASNGGYLVWSRKSSSTEQTSISIEKDSVANDFTSQDWTVMREDYRDKSTLIAFGFPFDQALKASWIIKAPANYPVSDNMIHAQHFWLYHPHDFSRDFHAWRGRFEPNLDRTLHRDTDRPSHATRRRGISR